MDPAICPSPSAPLCPCCGRPIEEDVDRKRKVGGRPKVYCDDRCRRLYHWLDETEVMMELLADRCTPSRWAQVRALLWGLLNSRAWNRGVARRDGSRRRPW